MFQVKDLVEVSRWTDFEKLWLRFALQARVKTVKQEFLVWITIKREEKWVR